ncbi:helix-turn-helix transcriptional regulator [Photobacterium kagoshimensis]|uniref:helix-turn-helix transcriptional regulator n=1 Tax=Photobacterium kagoshimensis TaxID=2910242 RepID=UPI003D0D3929
MSVQIQRYQKVLESIPCFPESISTLEMKQRLDSVGLINREVSDKSQMKAVQRILDKVSADHWCIEVLIEQRPYRYRIAQGQPHPVHPDAMSSVVSLQVIEQEINNLLPPTLRGETQSIFSALNREDNKQVALWRERFCYFPLEFQLNAPELDEEYFKTIELALMQKRDLKLLYQKRGAAKATQYDISPLGIVLHGNSFYLIAIKQGEFRTFALHRIQSLAIGFSTQHLIKGFDIREHVVTHIPHFSGGAWTEIILRIENYRGQHLLEEPLFCESQEIIASDDSYTSISAKVRDSLAFEWWLMKNANFVEIVSPLSIRAKVIESIRLANQMYGLESSA